jgi:hypothetical protein
MYPNENFFLKRQNNEENEYQSVDQSTDQGAAGAVQKNTQLAGFNVVESCIRQATFLWQVSSPCFSAVVELLEDCVTNYEKFVRLIGQKSKPQFLVPTYQIEI